MLKPKIGDLVRLKPVIVSKVNDKYFTINRGRDYFDIFLDMIEEILPRPLAVGDRVRVGAGNGAGEIVGLHGAWAWVFFKIGGFESYEIRRLTRIDEP